MKKFRFVAETSGNVDDLVVIPNIPLFSAAASMKDASQLTLLGFKAFLGMMDEGAKQMFLKKTVQEVIWGYEDQLSSMARFLIHNPRSTIPN